MKVDLSHQDPRAPDPAHTSAPKQDHAHEDAHQHAHGHAHDHDSPHGPGHLHTAGHDHGAHSHGLHRHAAPPPLASPAGEPRTSLLMRSAPRRLAGAVALSALLWAAVAWALAGTP